MNKKQFIALFSVLALVSIVYLYNSIATMTSRRACSDYAIAQAMRSFEDKMIPTGEDFPPKRLAPEASELAKANYDFFFDFCMDQREVAR